MSFLSKISLTQFRNYTQSSFGFEQRITSVTGPNGSGKTALLDAVYYLCYTKSYFSAQQQFSVKRGTEGFRVEGIFQLSKGGEEIITCIWRNGKKEVLSNGQAYEKIAAHIGRFAAVMIAPDDMALVHEAGEPRRRWVDSILSQTDPGYLEQLLRYQRVLQQRNAWLKLQAITPSTQRTELEFYDAQLHDAGTYIWRLRSSFFEAFRPLLGHYYALLSGGREQVDIRYDSELRQSIFSELLKQSLEQDLRLQRSTRGIHRDELSFSIEGLSMRQYGSQGQKKSFLFAMKLAQYAYIADRLRNKPILLLDDIFEKLDQQRMEALLAIIQQEDFGQVLLTDTHASRVQEAFGAGTCVGSIRLS
ncbi:MAG: DNA replication and repair protein RecF [Bacteroidetes bacterium]|nr:DNA replication and repair protein RecF [Bacteroidota bacterium]